MRCRLRRILLRRTIASCRCRTCVGHLASWMTLRVHCQRSKTLDSLMKAQPSHACLHDLQAHRSTFASHRFQDRSRQHWRQDPKKANLASDFSTKTTKTVEPSTSSVARPKTRKPAVFVSSYSCPPNSDSQTRAGWVLRIARPPGVF